MMNKTLEKYVNYTLLAGFLLLGGGIVISIIDQIRYGMPIEFVMILTGLALIILCFIIARIFGEMLNGKHKMG
jgi:hypothetical protein